MHDSLITLQGYLGSEPTLRTVGEHHVAGFRVASTPRRFNRATGQWNDVGETQWYNVSAWRQLGQNAAASLHKGDPVFVHGRLSLNSWVGKDGMPATSFEIDALVIGHDLTRTTTRVVRSPEGEPTGTTTFPEPEPRPGGLDEGEESSIDWGADPGRSQTERSAA